MDAADVILRTVTIFRTAEFRDACNRLEQLVAALKQT
jgi:hypothetical protein